MRRFLLIGIAVLMCALPAIASAESAIVLILDASGSMWGQIDGRSKIDIARRAIGDITANLPENLRVGLTVYGHRTKGDCADIEHVIPVGPLNRQLVMQRAGELNPKGKTPLSASVARVVEALAGEPATIILLTDGLETCDADPCATVGALYSRDPGAFALHVVGFGVRDDESAQLKCIAGAAGGGYFAATSMDELRRSLESIAAPIALEASLSMGNRGILYVDSARDFIRYTVYDDKGAEVASGDTRISMIPLPPGYYVVKGSVGSTAMSVEGDVEEGRTSELFLGGTGVLFVRAAQDFIKYEVMDEAGRLMGSGDTNISRLDLPAGAFTVSMSVMGASCEAPVVIEDGRTAELTLDCIGRVFVRGPKDFIRYEVRRMDGKVVESGDTNISTLVLPNGKYYIECCGARQDFEVNGGRLELELR